MYHPINVKDNLQQRFAYVTWVTWKPVTGRPIKMDYGAAVLILSKLQSYELLQCVLPITNESVVPNIITGYQRGLTHWNKSKVDTGYYL